MARTLNELRVGDVMIVDPPAVRAGATLREAALRLWRSGAESLLVTADDGAVLGFLSERELVWGAEAQFLGESPRAGDHVCASYLAARPEERFVALLERMDDAAVKRAVVLDRAGEPVGTVSLAGGMVIDFLDEDEAPREARATVA
jgi:CBS domain-containing protein